MRDYQPRKHKVDKTSAIAMHRGGMKQADIARVYNVNPNAINKLIKRTMDNKPALDQYRDNKPEIMEQIQGELLSAVDADDPNSASKLVVAAAVLQDKIQVMRGQANNIVGIQDLRSLTQLIDITPSIDDSIDDAVTS